MSHACVVQYADSKLVRKFCFPWHHWFEVIKVVFSALHLRFCAALPIVIISLCSAASLAQSTDQALPTPVSSYEINSVIRALDVGDSRQTHHYYAFNGT